ncbi:hypothetical protein VNO78_02727 [Psophocarpus tetragonolobus]|uniref:Uncharacterized protein n=1 Tax=Psophocarpus tetragonolobus TaxID=3891 RepID=A0AAN9T1S6_PSOTE
MSATQLFDRGGDRASALFHRAARSSGSSSHFCRPDRGGDRVSAAQIAEEIVFSAAQIATAITLRRCSTGPPAPAALRRVLNLVPDPVGSWSFGASRAARSTATSRFEPRRDPVGAAPPALQNRRRKFRHLRFFLRPH